MPTLFTRIIQGELPGRFVWKDELCVAFLSIEPLRPGHTLVVPRREIDHWIDVPDELHGHIAQVSKRLGHALQAAFRPAKVGVMIAGRSKVGASLASGTCTAVLVMCPNIATTLRLWLLPSCSAPLPKLCRGTSPPSNNTGTPSQNAAATPVMVLSRPGPEVTRATPNLPVDRA